VSDIVSNGEDQAAVSGLWSVNNKVVGMAIVYEFHVGSCRVKNERYYLNTASSAFAEYVKEAGCDCFPIMDIVGMCSATSMSKRDSNDIASSVAASVATQCLNFVNNGNAKSWSECFSSDVAAMVNGMDGSNFIDLTFAKAMFDVIDVTISIDNTFLGLENNVILVGTIKQVAKKNNAMSSSPISFSFFFNGEAKATKFDVIVPEKSTFDLLYKALLVTPNVMNWNSDVKSGLQKFVDAFGYPTMYTDNTVGVNSAMFDGTNGDYCFASVLAVDDESSSSVPIPHTTFAMVSFMVKLTAAQAAAAVTALNVDVSYETSTALLTVKVGSPAEATILFHVIVRAALGDIADSSTPTKELLNLYSVSFNDNNALTQDYKSALSTLCSKYGSK